MPAWNVLQRFRRTELTRMLRHFSCRDVLPILVAGCAVLLGGSSLPAAEPAARPNIVLLLADDLGYGDLGCYGAPDAKTPHIDRLAEQGVRFTSFYAAGAECTPSRVALLSGRYPQRPGGLECAIGTGNVGRYDDAIALAEQGQLGLPADWSHLVRGLGAAGYATGCFGKWHLGYAPEFSAKRHGFGEFFGFLGGNVDYWRHRELSDLQVLFENDRPAEASGYISHLITDRAVDFIDRHREQPFFLYVPFGAPHFPFQPPGQDPGRMHPADEWTKGTRETYVKLVEDLDHCTGRIVEALDRAHLKQQTLVIFASDHGAMQPGRNLPLSGWKGELFEGGIRAPLVVRWPGQLPSGEVDDRPCISMDLTVSLLKAAGAELPQEPPLDGIDVLQQVRQQQPPVERRLYWRARRGDRTWRAVRDGNLKYITRDEDGKRSEWLFDLKADPAEEHSLLAEQPGDLAGLQALLAAWEKDVRPERP